MEERGCRGSPQDARLTQGGQDRALQEAKASLFTEQPLNQPARRKAEGETECLPSGHAQHMLPKGGAGGHVQPVEPSKG